LFYLHGIRWVHWQSDKFKILTMGHHKEQTDHHSHGHHHNHFDGRNLLAATFINLIITITEIIGGIASGSLALLSDAAHNMGDTFAVLMAYIANLIGRKEATEKKTFGYKRVEILAALLNAVLLIVIIIFLFVEAYHRFFTPEPIKGLLMMVVAIIGLIANLTAVILLKKDSHHNLNVRAAYMHLLGDTFSSVAVIVASILIYFYHIYWIDPLVTILIGIYILKEAWSIMQEALQILMQSTPASVNIIEIVEVIEHFDLVDNVHHVHTWKLDDKQIHFECHIDVHKDIPISEADSLRIKIEKELLNKFGISHVTIQFEYNCCAEKNVIHSSKH
jgi:cobalt-zinc-cadmium efflux system protein